MKLRRLKEMEDCGKRLLPTRTGGGLRCQNLRFGPCRNYLIFDLTILIAIPNHATETFNHEDQMANNGREFVCCASQGRSFRVRLRQASIDACTNDYSSWACSGRFAASNHQILFWIYRSPIRNPRLQQQHCNHTKECIFLIMIVTICKPFFEQWFVSNTFILIIHQKNRNLDLSHPLLLPIPLRYCRARLVSLS